jgi:ABC-2 type transport system ATP-binding protein
MTQRLGRAAARVHDPHVLRRDEPTDGVDPVGRREIRDLLREEASRGRAVLLNSHLLSEIELTCDRVAVLRKGKVAAAGRIAELTAAPTSGAAYKLVASPVEPPLLEAMRETGAQVTAVNGHFQLGVRDVAHLNELIDRARAQGTLVKELTPMRSSLEDVFVDLVKASDTSETDSRSGPRSLGGADPRGTEGTADKDSSLGGADPRGTEGAA